MKQLIKTALPRLIQLRIMCILMMAGCTAGPDFQSPLLLSSDSYMQRQPKNIGTQSLHYTSAPGWGWWQTLGSTVLNERVEYALQSNLDIRAARARLERAKHVTEITEGHTALQLAVDTAVGRTRIGAADLGPDYRQTPPFSAYTGGLVGAFDLDMFGTIRRSIEQREALERVATAELDAIMLNTSAQIVVESIRSASVLSKIEIVDTLLAIEHARLALMQRAAASGATTTQAIDGQSRLISDLEGQLPALQQRRTAAENALAALSGSLPTQWSNSTLKLDDFVLPSALPLTVPSALASQRPDIQAAEAHLRVASAGVGIATSNRYPHIELRASLSQQGVFSGPAGLAWNAIGGLTAPLYEGGSLRAAQSAAEADFSAADATYRQVVISAFGQVADCLQALEHDAQTRAASEAAFASASGSLHRTEEAYRLGGASEMQMLDAQREQHTRGYQTIDARAQQLADSTALIISTAGAVTKLPSYGSVSRKSL